MDTNTLTAIIVVVVVFAVVVIVGMIVKQRFSGSAKVAGVEMKVGAEDKLSVEPTSKPRSGVIGNLSIGKTRIKAKGSGLVADNRSIGDTEISADSQPPVPSAAKSRSNRK